MDLMTIVEVRNDHPGKTHTLDYGPRRHVLPPGQKVLVPWEAVIGVLGDPRVHDVGRFTARRDEVARVQRYWGYLNGFDSPEVAAAREPMLHVYDTQGVRIHMLIDDPDNQAEQTSAELAGAGPESPGEKMDTMQRQLDALLANQARLTQLLEATQPGLLREEMPSLLGGIDAASAPPAAPAPPVEALGATVGVAADDGTQVIPVPPRGTAAVVDAPRGRTRS